MLLSSLPSSLLLWLCMCGRERGVDWPGVFSPLWLCLRYQQLHGCVLPVVAAAADVADVVIADVVVVVAVVVVVMVMYVW